MTNSKFQKILVTILFAKLTASCSFNFELTGQKTALENQVMGSYKELDDETVMLASVRGVDKNGKKKSPPPMSDPQKEAIAAKQDQDFNRDDIDDLKIKQIIGETMDGQISFLPKGIGMRDQIANSDEKLAKILIEEENRDREIVFKRLISANENLTSKDMDEVRRTYAKKQANEALPGHWLQNQDSTWTRKTTGKEGP